MSSAGKGKILLLSTTMGIGGGAEEQVMHLALELVRRGWQARIVSMIPPETDIPEEIAASGITVEHLGMRAGVPDPRCLFRLYRILRQYRPDVLHTHMTHANLLGRLSRILHPVPALVSTLHGFKMYGVNSRFTAFRELGHRLTDPLASMTTAICNAATQSYIHSKSAPATKIMAVPNGLDTDAYRPAEDSEVRQAMREELGIAQDAFVWLAVGRLESPKNYPLMLQAFARAASPTDVLLICGTGALRQRVEMNAKALGIDSQVRLLGVRRDIPNVMQAADAFVLSSDTEGLPMVLLQASSSALPIVATNVGGNAEVVIDGQTGFLTPRGKVEPLANAMAGVRAATPEDRAAMGAAGREHTVSKYDMKAVAGRWEELYSRLLLRNKTKGFEEQIKCRPSLKLQL
ncbi:glycosyl transferase family 1 [Bryobacterales bacterium F-183]|nr:glycosyl transferase family 1 [Bryobacterales bacterium F-183]